MVTFCILLLHHSFVLNVALFLILSGLVFLYSAIWHLLCLLINYKNYKSGFNAGALFGTWILILIVVPLFISVTTNGFSKVPPKLLLITEVREVLTKFDQKNSQILDRFYTDHPDFISKDSSKLMPLFIYKLAVKEMNSTAALYPVLENYKQKLLRQNSITNRFSLLSPAIMMQEGAEEIGRNSLSQFLDYFNAADSVAKNWREYFYPLVLGNRYLTVAQFRQLPVPAYTTKIDYEKLYYYLGSLLCWLAIVFFWTYKNSKLYERKLA